MRDYINNFNLCLGRSLQILYASKQEILMFSQENLHEMQIILHSKYSLCGQLESTLEPRRKSINMLD